MSGPMVKLADIANVVTGATPKKRSEYYDGNVPFVTPGDLGETSGITSTSRTLTQEGADSVRSIPAGSVMVCCIGATIGKVGIAEKTVVTNQQINSLVVDERKAFPKYVYYYCATLKEKLKAASSSTTMPIVNKSNFSQFEIPLPPLDEQKRIAAILDKADAIRQKRKQAIDLADEFLRSVFLDMFGDPVTNPKGWEVKACKDLFKRITVGIVVKPSSYYVESGVPALRSLNIGYYGIRSENLVYVSKSDNESILSKTRVYEGDLVIVRSGQPGKTAVVCKEFDGVNAIDILIATPKEELIDQQFFAFFMNSEGGKKIVLAEQRGQVQKHFNVGSLNSTAIPLPPLSLQRTFAEIVATVYGKYQTNKVTEFNEVFNSLSQKAFSGQL
ncbi:TPA: restriction endonuclease subunit S [Vibrio diabolicus]